MDTASSIRTESDTFLNELKKLQSNSGSAETAVSIANYVKLTRILMNEIPGGNVICAHYTENRPVKNSDAIVKYLIDISKRK